jgi:hypothetical protein
MLHRKRIPTPLGQSILDPHRWALRDELRAHKPLVLQLPYSRAPAAEIAQDF